MGCNSSKVGTDTAEQAANKKVEIELRKHRLKQAEVVKLLLLGAGESGKSTIFKQMKLLYGKDKGFNSNEKEHYKNTIHANIFLMIKQIIDQAESESLTVGADAAESQKTFLAHPEDTPLDPAMAEHIKKLWKDPMIQSVWARRSEFQVVETHSEYVEDAALDRIAAKAYVPNNEDVLRCRIRTSGITEEEYNIDGITFAMYDVGGQRNERKKWIHCFEDVTAVIFVVGLSEYDQKLFEDHAENRMTEALALFEDIVNNKYFADSSVILFLNKKDLFEEKLKRIGVKSCPEWQDYEGAEGSYAEGCEYFETKFREKSKDPNKKVYAHVTCATDSKNVQVVFETCKETILRANLAQSGFMT
jgi:GTPase SAR1 family protein